MTPWPAGSLLSLLDEPHHTGLMALGTRRSFARGDILFREGDPGRDVYVLTRGCVKVISESYEGRVALLAIRVAGDLIGELAVIDGQPRSGTAVVAAPTVAQVVERTVFLDHLRRHPDADAAIRRSIVAKLRQATRFRAETGAAPVTVRLARVLYRLALTYGRPSREGLLIDVPLSQMEIAGLVGAAEPSVQRSFAELRRTAVVTTGYRRLIVADVPRLQALTLEATR